MGLEAAIYAGNHGLEIEGPKTTLVEPNAKRLRPTMERMRQFLERALGSTPGVLIEDKVLTLSVHYRLTPPDRIPGVVHAFHRTFEGFPYRDQLLVQEGKMVFEVRPATPWNKGAALALVQSWAIQEAVNSTPPLPIYLGDDQTDEEAFHAADQLKGVSVFVGRDDTVTRARYRLDSPEEVQRFLSLLPKSAGP